MSFKFALVFSRLDLIAVALMLGINLSATKSFAQDYPLTSEQQYLLLVDQLQTAKDEVNRLIEEIDEAEIELMRLYALQMLVSEQMALINSLKIELQDAGAQEASIESLLLKMIEETLAPPVPVLPVGPQGRMSGSLAVLEVNTVMPVMPSASPVPTPPLSANIAMPSAVPMSTPPPVAPMF